MKITEPLMKKIEQLRATPKKELSGLQLIRTFIERQIQPLAARAHCMWDYSDRWDSTRISLDELREAKIDECVHAITNIKKKSPVPKVFGAVAFSKAFPRTEVRPLSNSSLVPQLCRLVLKTIEILAQVIEVARCYPLQPEVGDYPGHDFTEVPEGSTSAAPSPLMTHKYRGSQQSSREVLPKFIDSIQGEPKNICKP
jgi:hypothetical protein